MQYPHTIKTFEINGIQYKMNSPTLLFKSRLEDENWNINYQDILNECTDIDENIQQIIPQEEIEKICTEAITMGTDTENEANGKGISAIEIIAMLLNRGHKEPQYYRTDFVKVVFDEYLRGENGK